MHIKSNQYFARWLSWKIKKPDNSILLCAAKFCILQIPRFKISWTKQRRHWKVYFTCDPPASVSIYLGIGNLVCRISCASSTGACSNCLKFSYSGSWWYPAFRHCDIVCIHKNLKFSQECLKYRWSIRWLNIDMKAKMFCRFSWLDTQLEYISTSDPH